MESESSMRSNQLRSQSKGEGIYVEERRYVLLSLEEWEEDFGGLYSF